MSTLNRSPPTLFPTFKPRTKLPIASQGCCKTKSCIHFLPTLVSRIYFSWSTSFLQLGASKKLQPSDLYEPNENDTAKVCSQQLKQALRQDKTTTKRPNLCRAYLRAFGSSYWPPGIILRPLWLVLCIVQIFSLRELIAFIARNGRTGNTDAQTNAAIWSIFGFCFGALMQPLLICHLFIWSLRTGLRARAATTSLIWERLSTMRASELHSQRGDAILNLAEVDTVRIVDGFRYGHFMWCGILVEFPIVTYFVYREAGSSAFLGIFVLCCAIPCQAYFARQLGRIQSLVAKKTDSRARLMQEILTGIEMVKVNAWENKFSQAVNQARAEEVALLRTSEVYKALNNSVFQAAPLLAAACVFAIKSLASGQILESSSTFATLAWFNLIFRTLIMVPRGVSHFVEARVSATRVEKFLFTKSSSILNPLKRDISNNNNDNNDNNDNNNNNNHNIVVEAKECAWSWSDTIPSCLSNVTFTLHSKEVMCIIGEIGSGKTSLLCALQNDLIRQNTSSSSFRMSNVRTLYVPQTPFVVSCPLWENITFGLAFNQVKFDQVVKACQLDLDILTMVDGSNTEIGERGVTLSGGQNQRLSLARVCYAAVDGDLILCDDVLSALDTTVAAAIYRDVLSSETGILKNTTRIIATHALWSISHADVVLELNQDGKGSGARQDRKKQNTIEKVVVVENDTAKETLDANEIEITAEEDTAAAAATSTATPHELIQTEETEKGNVSAATWLRYIDSGVGRMSWMLLLLLFITTQVLRVGCDWWIANWTEDTFFVDTNMMITNETTKVITRIYDYEENVKYVIGYFSIVVIYCFFVYARTLLFTFAMLKSSQQLHNSMFIQVLHASMAWFWSTPTGRILNRFTRDVDCVDRLMVKSAQDWWNFMFIAIGAILTMISVIPHLLILVVPLLFVFLFYTKFFVKTSRQLKRISGTTRSPIYRRLEEYMNGINVVRSLKQEKTLAVPFQHAIDLNVGSEFLFEIASRWLGVRLDSLSALNNGVLALVAFVLAESLDAGLVGVALVQSLQLSGVLQYSIRQAAEVESLMTSVERVSAYSRVPNETTGEKETVEIPALWPIEGNIQISNLSLRYRSNLPLALNNINCSISSGEVLGICGRTGSGKSSLMTSFFRLVNPEIGSKIIIDGINIFDIPIKKLRRSLTVITQMPVLLGGTIRTNVDPFNEHNNDEVLLCLKKCQLIRRIQNKDQSGQDQQQTNEETKEEESVLSIEVFEGQQQTNEETKEEESVLSIEVFEGGTNFSAGERQLICVARALLANPKLLLLDEASSNIDPDTDKILQRMVRNEFKACTKLVIAHRIDTIIDADKILVLDKGKVVEFDTPFQLLTDASSHFSQLVDATGKESAAELRKAVQDQEI